MTLLFFALPYSAYGQEAILALICTDRDQAEVLAGEMTEYKPLLGDPRWSSCTHIGRAVGSMEGAPPPFMGPLRDWEGDPFALYTDGTVVFVIFWINGYQLEETSI